MALPQNDQLRKIIAAALKEKAPALHRKLVKTSQLGDFLSERVETATQAYMTAQDEPKPVVMAREKLPPLEQIASMNMRNKTAVAIALAQAMEFPSESDEA